MSSGDHNDAGSHEKRHFATTAWSVVLAAGDAERPDSLAALAQLCESYWYPLYAYARRRAPSTHEAQDQTQAFFAHLLEHEAIARADPERGRFRAYLLSAFRHFLTNEWKKGQAAKRGGGQRELTLDFGSGDSRFQIEPTHDLTPEKQYERRWVMTLLDQVLQRLRGELADVGKMSQFDELKIALLGEAAAADYERAGQVLGMSTAAAKQAAYRMRKRYRELLREEVARTVASDDEIDDEIGRLFECLGG